MKKMWKEIHFYIVAFFWLFILIGIGRGVDEDRNPTEMIKLILGIVGYICAGFCAYVAKAKNLNRTNWFSLGFLFSIIALIALIGLPVGEHNKIQNRYEE